MAQWIGPDMSVAAKIGVIGFLVRFSPQGKADRYDLRDLPAHTNMSHEAKLHGWCGETNNLNIYAEGMGKIVRVARNGRALVVPLEGDELAAALEDFGYPDLKG